MVWFKTSGTHGGSLMSVTNGTAATTMAMGMTSTGTLVLAIAASGTKSVSTSTAFNDSKWHLAVGVIGSSGMALYVDQRPAITSNAVTSTTTASGTVRVGYARRRPGHRLVRLFRGQHRLRLDLQAEPHRRAGQQPLRRGQLIR